MAKSVSKLVSDAGKGTVKVAQNVVKGSVGVAEKATGAVAKVAKGTVGVAEKGVGVAAKVAKGGVDMAAKVANKGVDVVTAPVSTASKAVTNTGKGANKVLTKLGGLCNPESIIPCVTALTLIAYIVIVSPATVLDMFSTPVGKAVSMVVVLIALLFDLKMGVMLGLAVVLSIALSSVNKDLYESFTEHGGDKDVSVNIDGKDYSCKINVAEDEATATAAAAAAAAVAAAADTAVADDDDDDDESFRAEVAEGFTSGGGCYKRETCKEVKPNCFDLYKPKTCKDILGVSKKNTIMPVPGWSGIDDCQYAPVLQDS